MDMQLSAQTYPQHIRAVLKLGLPLIASNLAQFAIHMTDTIMLGWYDVSALAAVTIASTMFFVVFIVGAGFAFAVTPLAAAAAEVSDTQAARRATRMAVWWSVIYGVVVSIPFVFSEAILLAIGQDPTVASAAQDYLHIAVLGMVPALLVMVLKSFLAGVEHTAVILWATILAAVLNACVNYVLIFGNFGAPELGLRGAAIASVLLQIATAVVLIAYILRRLPEYELLRNALRPDPEIMAKVFRLGLPIGLTSLAEGGLFAASAVMMGWIGELELAAHGIAIQLASVMFMVHIGLSQAATVRAGRALGRNDEAGLRRGGVVAFGLSGAFVVFTVILFLAIPELLISGFIDPDEPQRPALLAIGVSLLAVAALFQAVDALQVMALGLLRGVQDTAVPMVMAVVSYWIIGLPASYVLAFQWGLGPVGLWLGLVVGLSVAAVLMSWRFWRGSSHIGNGKSGP